MRIAELVARVRALVLDLARERPGDPVWLRCVRGHVDVEFRDRVFALAGQAFMALVPLLIVAATVASSSDGLQVAEYFVDKFGLTGTSADAMRSLFTRPPDAVSGTSVLSVGIVLFSVNSFSRSVRRTMDKAWRLPYLGMRGSAYGLGGVLVMVGASGLAASLSGLAERWGLPWAAALPIQFGFSVLFWTAVLYLLLARRVPVAALWPGAIYGSLAQTAAGVASSVYLPGLIGRNSERYGVIGVAVAIVWWLVILAAVVVSVSVVSAEIGRRRLPPGHLGRD